MPRLLVAIAAALLLCGLVRAEAAVVITVDKSAQTLSVAVDGYQRYEWPVSTARRGYLTPNGTYRPQRLERKWFSREYDWSPMPYSIFFRGGYAIHGSYEISRIGSPASHGCIRLHPEHAAVLFALVKNNLGDTHIVITGEAPPNALIARRNGAMRFGDQSGDTGAPRNGFYNGYEPKPFAPSESLQASPGDYHPWRWSPAEDARNAEIARKRWENLH